MPDLVRGDTGRGILPEDMLDRSWGEGSTLLPDKERAIHPACDKGSDGIEGLGVNKDGSDLPSLPTDTYRFFMKIDMLDSNPAEFRDPDTRRVDRPDKKAITRILDPA